jgi:hypothetical protein
VTVTDDVLDAAGEPLAAVGFARRRAGIFTMPLSDDFVGWLGLNTAAEGLRGEAVRISPVVGVRHQPTERLLAELTGRPFHRYIPPTIRAGLGELESPRRHATWLVARADPVDAISDVVASIAATGVPFVEQNADVASLCSRLVDGLSPDVGEPFRLPVALLIAGDGETASAVVSDAIARLAGRSDGAASNYRRFAESFERYVAEAQR